MPGAVFRGFVNKNNYSRWAQVAPEGVFPYNTAPVRDPRFAHDYTNVRRTIC